MISRLKHPLLGSSLLLLLLLTSSMALARPLYAVSLLEGRTYDQAHNSGYIDWSGNVQYIQLIHKDGSSLPPEEGGASCLAGCQEEVTRISTGAAVSGSFDRDTTYFEVMVAFSHDPGVGDAVLSACSATMTYTLYTGPGYSLPGFVSMPMNVPAGCRSWTLTASGGYVDFRSADVYYVAAPPTSTATRTSVPSATPTGTAAATTTWTPTSTATNTATYTPSPTATHTATSTITFTSTNTATATATHTTTPSRTPTSTATYTLTPSSTSTVTFIPTATQTATPSQTPTSTAMWTFSPTPTSTSTATAAQTATPSLTPTFTATSKFFPSPTSTATRMPLPKSTQTATFTAAASRTPTVISTSTTTSTASPSVTPTRTRIPASPTPVLIVPSPTPSIPTPPPTMWSLWQILGPVGLMIVIASASVVDPRPIALRRLGEIMEQISHNKIDSSQDEN